MSLDPQLLLKITRKTSKFFNELSDLIESHIQHQPIGPIKPNHTTHNTHITHPEQNKDYSKDYS